MIMERTFSIIKPDATEQNITGEINRRIEEAGLRIIAQKRILMTEEQAVKMYGHVAEAHGQEAYDFTVNLMTSGPIVVQVLQGENAVKNYRDVIGSTYPNKAAEGTIRKDFGYQKDFDDGRAPEIKNCVHGSGSTDEAEDEIKIFFTEAEIVG
ncbi:MAG: nucleoside-diphosphate kinase [Alphaproteobacteria bacterium]|nr:nucleoside-diphosphate kinase [Alphaproteobacteria bacterium]